MNRTCWWMAMTCAVMASCQCRTGGITGVTGAMHFELIGGDGSGGEVPTLVLGPVWADGAVLSREVNLINDGRSSLNLEAGSLVLPLGVEGIPEVLPPGPTRVTIRFTPTGSANIVQQLEVNSNGVAPAALKIQATSRAIPECVPTGPCLESHFSTTVGACVEGPAPDGTTCVESSKCIANASCHEGRCVGDAVVCDDANACTVDVCYPLTGCEHLPSPPCPGDGVCQVGSCNPKTGCELVAAEDGRACGPLQTCGAAQVCIDGACVVRDPPDGYVCEEASPCTDEGRCVAEMCVHAKPPTPVVTKWRYDSQADLSDAGVAAQYHDFVMEPSGEVSLGGFFVSPPLLRANTTHLLAAEGVSRRCVLWNGRIVCADYPAHPNGRVTAIDPATGKSVWSFNIRTSKPDFLALTKEIFLARLVVQGTDRLAALFEAYPANPAVPESSQCRSYFLAVIDASGALVTAQRVLDPLFDVCNHPHPYGVAADSVGNLYIAFSPSRSQAAPLVPDTPTLIMSYSQDGIFRWKRTDTGIQGGELAVARGLLYPENSNVVLHAPSGEPAFSLPVVLGRAVVSDTRLVPAPLTGASSLAAFEAGGTGARWTNSLPSGWTFWGEQVRLASWETSRGKRTVALALINSSGLHSLYGIDVVTGNTAFSCPVEVGSRTEPQLMEVGNGKVAIMNGALDSEGNPACLKCDPPLANSSAAFHVLEVPWISVAHESWIGTFGGAGHDHREEEVSAP